MAAIGGIGDDIGRAIGRIHMPTAPRMYEDPDFVAAHLAAVFDGVLPTSQQSKKLADKGIDFSKAVDDSVHNVAKASDRYLSAVKQSWSGLWLRFEDATFKVRLDGALRQQGEAIEDMTRAIQQYQKTVIGGETVIKSIKSAMDEISAMIKDASAKGDTSAVERLTQLYEVRNTAIVNKTKQIQELKTAMDSLGTEQKLLRIKHKTDLAEGERLKAQKDLNNSLKDLDRELSGALDKFTDLEGDIMRLNSRTITETQKAVNAAKQLNDSGGLIAV